MLDKTDQQIAAILEKLSKLADVHGDAALQMALQVARINAIEIIVGGVVCLLLAFGFGWASFRACKKIPGASMDGEMGWILLMILSGCVALGSFAGAVAQLTNYWAWVGLSDPKLYLAHKIMDKLL